MIVFFVMLLFCGVIAAQNENENQEFLDAQFLISENDSISYLVGNIRQYDIKWKEPGKPLYISVQKNKTAQNADQNSEFIIAYSNPFEDDINILFSLESEQNVTLLVYGANGLLFDRQNLGLLPVGQHNYLLALAAQKGQYQIVVQTGDKNNSNLIIKK